MYRTMPIKNCIDMLTTGIRTPVGVKIYGADTAVIERIGMKLEAFAVWGMAREYLRERVTGGGYFRISIESRRDCPATAFD